MTNLKFTTTSGSSVVITQTELEAFRAGLGGQSFTINDNGYDEERIIWNRLIKKHPGLIVQCTGAADVIDCVKFASKHNLLVAIRGGGHNVAGNSLCDNGLVIDLSKMNHVRVDPQAKRAFVSGGALLRDVDRETQLFGLAAPLGVVSATGVAGLTLCGGIGYLRRKYGMACDALVSVDIVTADGKFLKASESENSDLFWAIRGGGGNFGVVTTFEFMLYPVGPMVTLSAPFYPLNKNSADIVRKWRNFMLQAPDEIASNCLFWSVPAHPNFPEELHGKPVIIPAVVHIGNSQDADKQLQPIKNIGEPILDLSGPISYIDLQGAFDPLFIKAERDNYWKSSYLDTLTDDAIDKIIMRSLNRPDPWSLMILWCLGGAMNRVDPSTTAIGERNATFLYALDTSWTDPADTEKAISWTRESWDEIQPYSRGGAYLNFLGHEEDGEALLRASYGNDNYDHLVEIKTKYDPTNLFRLNQNILPIVVNK